MIDLLELKGKSLIIEAQLFPSLNYFLLWALSEDVILEVCENYQKSSYRNRFYLATSHGPVRLSVPLEKGKHQQMPIDQARMDNNHRWRVSHWRSIQTAYGKSPYFEHYKDELYSRYTDEEPFLLKWSLDNIRMVLKWLGWDADIKLTERYKRVYHDEDVYDMRNKLKPGSLAENFFTDKLNLRYEQVFSAQQGFTKNLSILDLIFCTGPEASTILKNTLREQQTSMDR